MSNIELGTSICKCDVTETAILVYFSSRMPSYDITGVFGRVRDKAATDKNISAAGLRNLTITQADTTNRPALQAAAK